MQASWSEWIVFRFRNELPFLPNAKHDRKILNIKVADCPRAEHHACALELRDHARSLAIVFLLCAAVVALVQVCVGRAILHGMYADNILQIHLCPDPGLHPSYIETTAKSRSLCCWCCCSSKPGGPGYFTYIMNSSWKIQVSTVYSIMPVLWHLCDVLSRTFISICTATADTMFFGPWSENQSQQEILMTETVGGIVQEVHPS